jgi:hypothetical protein
MNTLSISKRDARKAYESTNEKGRELLEHLLGADIFSEKITDRIKTLEDALEETGRPGVPEFNEAPKDFRPYLQAHYKAVVIAEALNEGWKADYTNGDQRKWFPWFRAGSSGFAFYVTHSVCSYPSAGSAARLCLKSEELATYAGEQFKDIYEVLITK